MYKASPHFRTAFTLIEMLMVMLIIAILASLVLSLNGLASANAARARAQNEIQNISAACESYKNDHGIYPRSDGSSSYSPPNLPTEGVISGSPATQGAVPLNPTTDGNPSAQAYKNASLYLYTQLSGDLNYNGIHDASDAASYISFSSSQLGKAPGGGGIAYLQDPYGNSYGYSTAAAADEDCYQAAVKSGVANPTRVSGHGFNPSFDLWSTGGRATDPNSSDPNATWARWIKN